MRINYKNYTVVVKYEVGINNNKSLYKIKY